MLVPFGWLEMSQYSPIGSSVSVPNQDFSRCPPQIRGTARGVNLTDSVFFMKTTFHCKVPFCAPMSPRDGGGDAATADDVFHFPFDFGQPGVARSEEHTS